MALRHTLPLLLAFAVLTIWVPQRWALGVLEAAIFLSSCGFLLACALSGRRPTAGFAAWLVLLGCLWAVVQLAAHWSVVPSATVEAALYWLAAGCLVILGHHICREGAGRQRFLKTVLMIGSLIAVVGTVQLSTSPGRIFWLFPSGYDSSVIGPFVSPNNYAAFVELLVPVALALAFQSKARVSLYLLLAAVLAASVVAAGSRAGAILIAAEAAAAFLVRARRQPGDGRPAGRGLPAFALLAVSCVLVVGYQPLWERFRSDRDPYRLRREFLHSSLAMFRAEPWHGFGMGSWPSVYPQFAIVDAGTAANHAHNEWVQWSAEGGWPLLLVPAAIFLWALAPALRSIWGIGILAVFIHSWVDYPFMRLGMAAWIFALLGALVAYRGHAARAGVPRLSARLLAGAAIPVLLFATFQTSRLAWADTLYRRATPSDLTRASALCPENSLYHFALAQADPEHAVPHLEAALARNAYLTKARLALAAELEWRQDWRGGEAALLAAARHDRQYAPAWALASFYFRRDRPDQFWQWARTAAGTAPGHLDPLFDLCFQMSADGQAVLDRVAGTTALAQRLYLAYTAGRGRWADADAAALRLSRAAGPDDREMLLSYIDRSLVAGRAGHTLQIWNSLCTKGLLPYSSTRRGRLFNGDFAQPILNRAWDWTLMAGNGAAVARLEDRSLRIALSGRQPEQVEILSHFLALDPSTVYTLRFQYRTADLPDATGIFWSLAGRQQTMLAAVENWTSAEWHFRAPGDLTRLALGYRRQPGTTRTAGKIFLRQVELQESRL